MYVRCILHCLEHAPKLFTHHGTRHWWCDNKSDLIKFVFDLIHIPESIWQVGNKYFLVYNVFENVFEWIILFTVFFCSYQCIYESNICVIAYDHDYDSDVKIRL